MKKRFVHQTRNLEPHQLEVVCKPNKSVPYKPKCFYASAYLGEDSKYPSEWVKWCSGEEYTSGDLYLYIFDVDMSNVLVIDTVEDYKRAVRLYHSSDEGLGNYYYFRPDFAFMDGWKGVYYTQNIADTIHLNGVSDHVFGSIVNYSNLNALDTDQILIFDPSIIDKSSFKRLPYTWSSE